MVLALAQLWRLRGEWRELETRTTAFMDDSRLPIDRRLELYYWASGASLPLGHDQTRAGTGRIAELTLAAGSGQSFHWQVAHLRLAASWIAFSARRPKALRGAVDPRHGRRSAERRPRARGVCDRLSVDAAGQRRGWPDWEQALRSARDSGNLLLEGHLLNNLSEQSIASTDAAVTSSAASSAGLAGRDLAQAHGEPGWSGRRSRQRRRRTSRARVAGGRGRAPAGRRSVWPSEREIGRASRGPAAHSPRRNQH